MSSHDVWELDEEFQRQVLAEADSRTPEEAAAFRKCLAEIHADPLNRGQAQRTTDLAERGIDEPPPGLILYWARVSPNLNVGLFYIVDTEEKRIITANLGPSP